MQKLFDCNCTIPLRVGDSLGFSRRLVRLVRQQVLYRLGLKEGAQRNVEIASCICKVPFQVRDGLHCSGKLVMLMLGSNSGKLVRLFRVCKFCSCISSSDNGGRRTDAPYAMQLEIGGLHAFSDILVRLIANRDTSYPGRLASFQRQFCETCAMQIKIPVARHYCDMGGAQLNVEIVNCVCKLQIPLHFGR